jgi:hypothetical protein
MLEVDTKVQKRIMYVMEKEFSTIVRGASMSESGIKTRCMVKAFFITLIIP